MNKQLLRGLPIVLGSNLVSTLVQALVVLILPRFVTPTENGHVQYYLFVVLYLGYVTFGYSDGIFLRIGGRRLHTLDGGALTSGLVTYLVLVSGTALTFAATAWFIDDPVLRNLFWIACAATSVSVPRTLISVIFQVTDELRKYATTLLSEKASLILLVTTYLVLGNSFTPAIFALFDLGAKLLSLVVGVLLFRPFLQSIRGRHHREDLRRFLLDCRAGFWVLGANLMAIAINGVARLVILQKWSIETFGHISLALSLTSFFMVFVTSISVTLFPKIRAGGKRPTSEEYQFVSNRLLLPTATGLFLYFPLSRVLTWWMPGYELSLYYLGWLFPVFLLEARYRMSGAIFLKALRAERWLLVGSASGVLITFAVALVGLLKNDLLITVLSIVAGTVAKTGISELRVVFEFGLNTARHILVDLLFILAFYGGLMIVL